MTRFFSASLCCAVCLILLARGAMAQSVYGGIQGTVRDATGEPVDGATVVVKSEEKGTEFKLKTNHDGHYEFPELLPDSYGLSAQAGGAHFMTTDISVVADDEALVNVVLPAGGQTVSATGTPGGSTLKTRSDISITLDRNVIQDLPNFTRNFTAFPLLAAGVVERPAKLNASMDPQQSLLTSLNGQIPNATALILDGTENRGPLTGGAVVNPPLESLAEIKIATQSYDAETGQALSGVVTAETRSGTNSWHGSLFDFRRSSWGAASSPNLNNPSLQVTAPFKINQAGGSLGGPIVKNKVFIFGDYQATRQSFSATQFLNVPTQLVRDTCLSGGTSPCDLSQYGSLIADPTDLKGKPFAGCPKGIAGMCIPADDLSAPAVKLLSLLPAPNVSDPNAVVSNYEASQTEGYNGDNFDVRVDGNASQRLNLFSRYSFVDYRIDSPSAFGPMAGGPGLGAPNIFAGTSRARNQSLAAGFDDALSPSLLTDFRFGYYRIFLDDEANSVGTTPATNAGIPGLNLDSLSSGMPAITIVQPNLQQASSNIVFGDGQQVNACTCPLNEHAQQFQWTSNWAKEQGNHLFKWGADFRYAQVRYLNSAPRRTGLLNFNSALTNPTGMQNQGLGLATFLLGYVTTFQRTLGSNSDAQENEKRLFFYAQDTWRATPRLTFSYGLRWEIYYPQTVNGRNDGGYLDLATGNINVAGYPCCDLNGGIQNSFKNLAPRLGLAYQIDSKTILRAGYGRNFDRESALVFGPAATQNPPVSLVSAPTASMKTMDKQFYVFQLGQTPPVPPAETLSPNVPANGIIPASDLVGISVTSLASKIRVPTVDQWSLSLQRELTSNLYFDIGYAANKGTHLPLLGGAYNLNQPNIAGYASNQCYMPVNEHSPQCENRYPFFQSFGWLQSINDADPSSSSNYNALQAKLVKRFTKGYEFQANYSFAKGLAYAPDYYVQDPGLNYGPDDFDRKHTFNFYNVLALPFGRGKPWLANVSALGNYFVGGWSINTITTWASGLPFSPTYSQTECNFDRDTGPCRPNQVGAVHITGDRNNYFTTTNGVALSKPAFPNGPSDSVGPWQRPVVGTFGNTAINSLRGPSYYDTDLAVSKNLPITEGTFIQFRTDFLNVFNRVNLGLPSGCVDCSMKNTAGTSVQTGAVITTLAQGASQRQVQFSLRFQF